MRKFLKKIICVAAAAVMGASLFATSACSDVYKGKKLDGYVSDAIVTSNGGFAVQKGDFIYYINGKQSYTADNTIGKVETGAIMRISKDDLDDRNYANAQTVVPEIAYSGDTGAGIFIYGDYVYYSTPSAEKNSDGGIQNSNILFKRAKLDGSEVMKDYFTKYSNNSVQYRFVEDKDKDGNVAVYLIYVATSENLYGTSCTNIHSLNTETGKDTILAYNIGKVMFDSKDPTNPRIYYTMSVKDFALNTSYSSYNQVYTVTAAADTPNEYDFSDVKDYDEDEDPLYINCGDLVLDGIGWVEGNISVTQFNAKEVQDAEKADLEKLTPTPYTYTLSDYQNGTLFYSRSVNIPSTSTTDGLFAVSESELLAEGHEAAFGNPEDNECLLENSSNASSYTYIFENNTLTRAFISSSNGLIMASVVPTEVGEGADKKTVNKLPVINDSDIDIDNENTFYLTRSGTATILFTEGDYVYFTESSSTGSIYSLNYNGGYDDYNKEPVDSDSEEAKGYTPVRILDLVYTSDWYKPEMFDGRILFSTETKTMTEYSSGTSAYSHIMICDINGENGVMNNKELSELNEKYDSISEKIEEVDEETYEHLKNAYYYAFFTGDKEYIDKVIKAYVDIGEDEEYYWSKESVAKFKDFVDAKNDWSEYNDDTVTVNGKEVYSNQRDYYYSLLGTMTKSDAEAYNSYVRDTYLQPLPEEEEGWFESLSKGAKAGFIIGILLGAMILAAAITVVTLIIIRKRKSRMPAYTKRRIKVDTTDDKSVDVYSTEDGEGKTDGDGSAE